MEKEKQEKIILKKISIINKHYADDLALEETGNSIYPYAIKTRTKTGCTMQSKLFENLEQVYYYILGIMYVLAIEI